jgi:hypothetical protein
MERIGVEWKAEGTVDGVSCGMGYMGFGMRKDVYERKPVKRSLWSLGRAKTKGSAADLPDREARPYRTMKDIQGEHRWRLTDHFPSLNGKTVVAIIVSVLVALVVLYVVNTLATAALSSGSSSF